MQLHLNNHRVLIAGGSQGIGLAVAKLFKQEGAIPILVARNQQALQAASVLLDNCEYHVCDLQNSQDAAALCDNVGAVDILINCAGSTPKIPTANLDTDLWAQGLQKKLYSYLNVIDPMIKLMASQGHGVIVNVIGIGGKLYSQDHLVGGTANSALMMMTAGYARDYAAHGVRVIGINPAGVETPRLAQIIDQLSQSHGQSTQHTRSQMLADYPQKEFVRMQTVASTIVFLSSQIAHSITGTTIQIDGGRSPMI